MIRDWLLPMLAGFVGMRRDPAPAAEPPKPYKIRPGAVSGISQETRERLERTYRRHDIPPGVLPAAGLPENHPTAAMDDASSPLAQMYAWALSAEFGEGLAWLGYQYLAELAQRPEYRLFTDVGAEEMTRKWITFENEGEDDKADKIKKLSKACEKFELRNSFYALKQLDGLFGIGHLYIDIDGVRDQSEVLSSPLVINRATIKKGSLRRFTPVEPMWTYPAAYNAQDPLRPDFYKPVSWYVMGKTVHQSRLLTLVSTPVPDILKAQYSFGGLSMTQMLKPYVDWWLSDRSATSQLVTNFSTMVMKTDMSAILNGGGAEFMISRAALYNQFKNNNGLMFVNKGSGGDPGEEMTNVAVPLSTLDRLVAQSQEHMASIGRTPLVKAFGITPTGLNQSSDGEIRSFYDTTQAAQERDFGPLLRRAIDIIQLSEFGEIDPDITWRFEQLWQVDDAGQAAIEKTKSDIDLQNVEMGALSPEEVRQRLAKDKKSPYVGIDLAEGEAPGTPDVDGEGKPINDPLERSVEGASTRAGGAAAGGAASGV